MYAQSGRDKVKARAQQRGDFYAKDDSRMALKKAISYYFVGGREEKIKSVGAKAAGLGKQAEAAKQKAEEGRKKTFKKDQDDLEKALAF